MKVYTITILDLFHDHFWRPGNDSRCVDLFVAEARNLGYRSICHGFNPWSICMVSTPGRSHLYPHVPANFLLGLHLQQTFYLFWKSFWRSEHCKCYEISSSFSIIVCNSMIRSKNLRLFLIFYSLKIYVVGSWFGPVLILVTWPESCALPALEKQWCLDGLLNVLLHTWKANALTTVRYRCQSSIIFFYCYIVWWFLEFGLFSFLSLAASRQP